MKEPIVGIALLLLIGGTGSSAHADGPWCAFYDVSTYNCGFYSYEQCYENAEWAARADPISSKATAVTGQPTERHAKSN